MHPAVSRKTGFFAQYLHMISACWRHAGGDRRRMVLFYCMFVVANAIFMAQPYVIGELINTLQRGGDGLARESAEWLLYYVGTTFFLWVFHGPARVMERDVAYAVKKSFNLRLYDCLTRLPLHWHHSHHSGNTINRVAKASQAIAGFAETQFVYLQSAVRFFAIFVALAFVDIYVCAALFAVSCLIFWMLARFDRVIMRLTHAVNEREHVFSSYLFDFVSNAQNVAMFNLARATESRLGKAFQSWYPDYSRRNLLGEWKWFLMSLLIVLSHFGVLYFYIVWHLEAGEALMLGTLVTIFQYMIQLSGVFVTVATNYSTLVQQHTDLASVGGIEEDFGRIGVKDDGWPALEVTRGEIAFENLSFAYSPAAQVFDGFDLRIGARQKVGLIGHSGAGKTTLAALLLRFYEIDAGRVSVDGRSIRDVSTESLRDSIAVIPQDTALFEDTLMENIRFGRLGATDEEVIAAAKKANCHDFIMQTPGGYGSMVGERGVKLSGGQRQRVAIARAMLKAAPIIILDEATSALDSESERLIQQSLAGLMEGRTVIAIAHRLSTIAHLDRLVVLQHGRVVEDGTHATLLAAGGPYAKLWAMQSGGFLPE